LLTAELVRTLNEIFPPDVAAGDRYVAAMKALVNV
jgi:hypothetical protein